MPTSATRARSTRRPARRRPLGRPRARDRSPEETRERLIEAAAEVFAEQGYEGASIQTIARAADLTSGTIYRHFESKAALLLAVVSRAVHAIPLAESLDDTRGALPADIAKLVSIYASPALARTRRLAIEVHAAASREPDARAQLMAFNEQMHAACATKIRACIASGLVAADVDPERAASLLLVMIMGLAHLETLQPGLVGDRRFARYVENAVFGLLGAEPK